MEKKTTVVIIIVLLAGIGVFIVSINKAYIKWMHLKTRNDHLISVIEKQKRVLANLREHVLLKTIYQNPKKNTPSSQNNLSPKQEHAALLSGYVKRSDHVIEFKLPTSHYSTNDDKSPSKSAPHPLYDHPKDNNWRGWIIFIYVIFTTLAMLLYYNHKKSKQLR
ncbi:hypothetical protein COTS27_00193 [Spirochaetota bacterium]|nr:hypothetical protein COTS27_00193 [Spirochaetota bacterium]